MPQSQLAKKPAKTRFDLWDSYSQFAVFN